jgi:hypothetical protein
MASHGLGENSGKVVKPRGKGKANGAVATSDAELKQLAKAVDIIGIAASWANGKIDTDQVLAAIKEASNGGAFHTNKVVFRCTRLSGTVNLGFTWHPPAGGPAAVAAAARVVPISAALVPAAPPALVVPIAAALVPAATQCAICWDAVSCVVFGPCGHLTTCDGCAAPLRKCPLCRGTIESRLHVFF